MVKKRVIHSLREMREFAQEVATGLNPGDVIGLVGDLGAGKTTFVQSLANALGVKDRVNSPTFLVLRIYNANTTNYDPNTANTTRTNPLIINDQLPITTLVHIDAYRLKSAEDLEALGAMEYIGAPDTITVIEWADRVKGVLPKKTKWITFRHGKSETQRLISYER